MNKYIASFQIMAGQFSHMASDNFDDCFKFLLKNVEGNNGKYKKAFIENIEMKSIILSMREI